MAAHTLAEAFVFIPDPIARASTFGTLLIVGVAHADEGTSPAHAGSMAPPLTLQLGAVAATWLVATLSAA